MLTYWIFKIINFGKYSKFCFKELKTSLLDISKGYYGSNSSFYIDYVIGELSKKCIFSDNNVFQCCRSYIKFVKENFL